MVLNREHKHADTLADGTTHSRSLEERFSEEINVLDYGAKRDGTTDDSGAINAAFDELRSREIRFSSPVTGGAATSYPGVVRIPPGRYRIDSPINATLIRGDSWIVKASGALIDCHATGKAALDMFGSRFGSIYDLTILGDETDQPKWGVQVGRDSATVGGSARVGDVHNFYNFKCIGWYTGSCIYNFGSESTTFYSAKVWNQNTSLDSYCVISDGNNAWGATSDYALDAAANTAVSNNALTFLSLDSRKARGGPCIFLNRTSFHAFYRSYAVSFNDVAIVIDSDSFGHRDLFLEVHCETSQSPGLEYALQFRGSNKSPTMHGFYFRDQAPHAKTAVIGAADDMVLIKLVDAEIHVASLNVVPSQNMFSPKTKFNVIGGHMHIPTAAQIPNINLHNQFIVTDDRDSATLGHGTQVIFDKINNEMAVKGEIVVYDRSNANVAAGDLGNLGRVRITGGYIGISDGIAEPALQGNTAKIYVDEDDGDMRVKFGDGAVARLTTQSIRGVAAATSIAVTLDDVVIKITGSSGPITNITGGTASQILTLLFTGASQGITDTAAGAGKVVLEGGVDWTSAGSSTVTLLSDGVNWYEMSRSKNN